MATRLTISFKDTPEDKELLEFLQKKSTIIGHSGYIKLLLQREKKWEEKQLRKGK